MKRLSWFVLVAMLAIMPGRRAEAQIKPGIHVARAADVFGGANGVGASLELSLPLAPVDIFAAGDYFFPNCGTQSGCSFWGGSAALHFTLPIPVVTPYASAGLAYRRYVPGGSQSAQTHVGPAVGIGLNLGTVVLGAYADARYEFVDPNHQILVRLGLRF